MRRVYFNENEPFAAAWLRRLFPDATIDDRSVTDVAARDLAGYDRTHMFGGIGGWEHALELAGWPRDRPVWTGSCPCQPFSIAGNRRASQDARDLWPDFRRLIAECHPATVFGEQVASRLGREWFARVRVDLEALGYAVGGADLCAAGVGAPHIRQRLFWLAVADSERCPGKQLHLWQGRSQQRMSETPGRRAANCDGMGHADGEGPPQRPFADDGWRAVWNQGAAASAPSAWSNAEWIDCADGTARRIESGVRPLANGFPGRVGRLRGYGNAIVPQVAAAFVRSYIETEG